MSWFSNPVKAIKGITKIALGDYSGLIKESVDIIGGDGNPLSDTIGTLQGKDSTWDFGNVINGSGGSNTQTGGIVSDTLDSVSGFGDSIKEYFVRGSLVGLAIVFVVGGVALFRSGD